MRPPSFQYVRPRDLSEALGLICGPEDDDCRIIAGGQSLVPMLNLRMASASKLIDISDLPELRELSVSDSEISIGAAITHAHIEDGIGADSTAALLSKVAAGIAYRPVRNRGTVAGSLAHADPAGDWAPVLMGLGATSLLKSIRGEREIDVAALIEAPLSTTLECDELIRSIRIPRLGKGARTGHVKFSSKPGAFAESLAFVVCDQERDWFRVVLATSTDSPSYLCKTSEVLEGVISGRASADADQIRDVLAGEVDALAEEASWDKQMRQLHQAIVARAIRKILACM